MAVTRNSPCKINLILNILGRRQDGFHELETILQPVPFFDTLEFEQAATPGVTLVCNHPSLPVDDSNLVVRAARLFMEKTGVGKGVQIKLQKNIPLAAGLAGGSSNGAVTLSALNELFGMPLSISCLMDIAAGLGSDVPFFLQDRPALATGRGERLRPLDPFNALKGRVLVLIHPGFGISTTWAYKELANHPRALNGEPGRAARLLTCLQGGDLRKAADHFYNSLEAPALRKFPILALYQERLREEGAEAVMMSGSGSTTFAFFANQAGSEKAIEAFQSEFGREAWIKSIAMP